jgi:hypothetical protein
MKRALLGLLVVGCTIGLASVAFAGENAIAGISLHTTTTAAVANPCTKAPPTFPKGGDSIDDRYLKCTQGLGKVNTLDLWVGVCNGSDSLGVKGVEFGIDYDGALGSGVDVDQWIKCSDGLEFPQDGWPAAGTGTIVTWTTCQIESSIDTGDELNHQVIAVAGVFRVTVYGRSYMSVTPRPVTGLAKVADCLAAEDVVSGKMPSQLGIAGMCKGAKGYNFCGSSSLDQPEVTTWGTLKSLYN